MYECILLLCLQWNTIPIPAIQYNNIKEKKIKSSGQLLWPTANMLINKVNGDACQWNGHDVVISNTRENTRKDETECLLSVEVVETKPPFVEASSGESFLWPGSKSTQNLGIFSLVHMLSIKENQQLAASENLIPYLICLSWQLDNDVKQKLLESLANFHVFSPPSLKVAAKSVLARVKGLDLVFNS